MAQADQNSAPAAAEQNDNMEDETIDVSTAASNNTMDSELTSSSNSLFENAKSLEERLTIIKELAMTCGTPKSVGETWYIIDAKWLASFFDSESSGISPGPIDNSHLIEESSDGTSRVKEEAQEQQDYDIVPEIMWNGFQAWFGGGPAIPRKSIIQNPEAYRISYTIEVRPCEISVALQTTSNELEWVDFEFSKNATIKEVLNQVKRDFNIENKECKLWKAIYNTPHEEVNLAIVDDQILENALERKTGQRFIVEVGPNWIIEPPQVESSTNAIRSMSSNKVQISGSTAQQKKRYDSAPPGVCGLSNLGNTCFMNSGLQCLTHAPVLYKYFLENDYTKEINETNPLGMGGAVANAFGTLMREMWSGENSYFSPNDFKRVIGKYAPQFAGYQQQDSQELISFILDGLHEDLNRIQKKPATNPVEAKGREDTIVAQESWDVHKLRNDSVIVDKFQGQLKSTLHCPKCDGFSIIFDPFMYLSLPIPIEKNRLINIIVFSNTTLSKEVDSVLDPDISKLGNMPSKITCKVSKTGSVSQLRDAVLELLGYNPAEDHDRCILYEIFSNKVYKYLSDGDSISQILEQDNIQCQILPKPSDVDTKFSVNGKSAEKLLSLPKNVHFLYRQNYSSTPQQLPFVQVSLTTHATNSYGRRAFQQIGTPFVIPLGSIFEEKKEDQEQSTVPTHADLYEYCFHYMLRYLSDEFVATIEKSMNEEGLTFKDFLPSKEKLEALKNGERTEENTSLFYLFDQEGGRFEVNERTYEGTLLCDDTEFKPYAPRYTSARTEKKSIFMHIPAYFHEKMLDYDKLPKLKEHPSTNQKISQSEAINIYQCLELYTTMEKLGVNDTWYCPSCKEHVEATKKFDIWKFPDVLVIHLKRFSFSTYSRDKIDRFIDYPIQDLDLSSFVRCKDVTNLKYDLFAVSDHFGGLGGGHYTACAKNHSDGKWYKFDDSRASEVHNPESIKASSNYVLFYIRKE